MSVRKRNWVGVAVVSLIVVVGLSFCAWKMNRPFQVPTGAMAPAILPGTLVLVDEWAYGSADEVKRGDIVTFYTPDRAMEGRGEQGFSRSTYVFRIMGIPGDHIKVDKLGKVTLNGELLESRVEGDRHEEFQGGWYEILPMQIKSSPFPSVDLKLSKEKFFVMGDNRGNAYDSRFWGPVPYELIRGRARL